MIARLFLIVLWLLQPSLPKHFHAYQVAANGKNVLVDPVKAQYGPCDVDLYWKDNQLTIGRQSYTIYSVEHPGDSLTALFAVRQLVNDHQYVSAALFPMQEKNHWMVLVTWEDSTKAFKTTASK